MIERAGYHCRGAEMLVHSEVPIGSGLSSSAAIEVATGFALLDTSGVVVIPLNCQSLPAGRKRIVGMRCGLMDQFISCFGRTGHAIMLDCRSLEYKLLPLPNGCESGTLQHDGPARSGIAALTMPDGLIA